jgi:5-methylthioadenosine/S-adenosylhomocysteine deaminase
MTTALSNVSLLCLDPARRVIGRGAVIIRGARIEALGEQAGLEREIDEADEKIDGRGMLAMPGLVNAHTHTFQSLLRGLADGKDLLSFLRDLIYPVTAVMTPEEIARGAAVSVLEAIKSGTTCLIDNLSADTSFETTDDIAQVMASSGIRGVVARGIRLETPRSRTWRVPPHVFAFNLAEEIDITRSLIEKWRERANGRVGICPAPLTLFLAGPDDLRQIGALAQAYETPVEIHIAESQSEVAATLEDYGCREVELLDRVGLLNERLQAVHCVWLEDAEIDLLAASAAHVIHCPTSNMLLGSGVTRLPRMIESGLNIALGSDGIGNYDHDMFSVMRATSLLQRVHNLRPDAIGAEDVVYMATMGGARSLGLEREIGSLEPGKRADLILLDLDQPHHVPVHDLASAIVHGTQGADVDTVIIDGHVVMQGRQIRTMNETQVISEAKAAGLEVTRRAGVSRSTASPAPHLT